MDVLSELLKGKSIDDFSPDQLIRKAHWRWDRDQFYAAFFLFDAADQLSTQKSGYANRPARNRAALTLYLSGENVDDAIEGLNEVISYYEAKSSTSSIDDSHFVEWAATHLLEYDWKSGRFAKDPAAFSNRLRELKHRCDNAGRSQFPSIHPQQETIAEIAFDVGAVDVLATLVGLMQNRKPMTRQLRARLKAWSAAID